MKKSPQSKAIVHEDEEDRTGTGRMPLHKHEQGDRTGKLMIYLPLALHEEITSAIKINCAEG